MRDGAALHFSRIISKKTEPEFLQSLREKFGRCFIIPEGGSTNELAVRGCEELGKKILKTDFDYCCLPIEQAEPSPGIINAFDDQRKIIGIPVLKDGGFLNHEVKKYLTANYKTAAFSLIITSRLRQIESELKSLS